MVKLNKQHWAIKAVRDFIAKGVQRQTIGAVILTINAPDETGLFIITARHTTANATLQYIAMVANGTVTLIQSTIDPYGSVFYTAKQTSNSHTLSDYALNL